MPPKGKEWHPMKDWEEQRYEQNQGKTTVKDVENAIERLDAKIVNMIEEHHIEKQRLRREIEAHARENRSLKNQLNRRDAILERMGW